MGPILTKIELLPVTDSADIRSKKKKCGPLYCVQHVSVRDIRILVIHVSICYHCGFSLSLIYLIELYIYSSYLGQYLRIIIKNSKSIMKLEKNQEGHPINYLVLILMLIGENYRRRMKWKLFVFFLYGVLLFQLRWRGKLRVIPTSFLKKPKQLDVII